MRHFDVQLMGGMILHQGKIAEMRTGEGKTLVATLPVYLNALESRGVHVITVNDYLAKRDSEWMGQVYRFLGLSVGVIVHGLYDNERRQAYASDVTYGTNNEFGFDYLRDNMKYSLGEMVQRGHRYAIVDEVDSILIDEARTPLIISGPTEDRSEFYRSIDALIPLLRPEHFEHDEKQRSVTYTELGSERIEEMLVERGLLQGSLYEPANISIVHHANQALRAHKLFHRDKDYIVKDGEIVLIDEFTGRMMHGRRLSEGLHQAIEAKEGAQIQPENQTLASITFQNYFRLYDKLAGMTGTASTEAAEFGDIYKLDVVEIPTNRRVKRIDDDDEVYRTAKEKYKAIIADIEETHRKQPAGAGRHRVDREIGICSPALLKQRGIPHQVLNARYHEQEAAIVAQAGVPGAVTIATNMAGRGTDIQLGGNLDMRLKAALKGDETPDQIAALKRQHRSPTSRRKKQVALAAGGLYVLGTERHESRRIDNQLRGRTGRQGDPGKSKFYICLEDDLLRIFAAERLDAIMRGLGIQEGEAIVHPWMNKALETSQRRVEQRNFEIRKNLLKYDDVINDQRKAIFEQRIEFMRTADVAPIVRDMRHDVAEKLVRRHMPEKAYPEQWDVAELTIEAEEIFGLHLPLDRWAAEEGIAQHEIIERLTREIDQAYAQKAAQLGPERLRAVEKQVLLSVVDMRWREHLSLLDHLRSVIHLRGYAQRDPLNEFKTEAFTLFERMLLGSAHDGDAHAAAAADRPGRRSAEAATAGQDVRDPPESGHRRKRDGRDRPISPSTPDGFDRHNPRTWGKVCRNAPCPCGSGKKFKYCHGAEAATA